jgi:hypothetical protein
LFGERAVESHGVALGVELLLCGRRANQKQRRIAWCEPDQKEHEGDDAKDDGNAGEPTSHQCWKHD